MKSKKVITKKDYDSVEPKGKVEEVAKTTETKKTETQTITRQGYSYKR